MDTNDFSTAKVGDRVWDFFKGWGTVVGTDSSLSPIRVSFGSLASYWFTNDGRLHTRSSGHQTLFWDEVVITPPPRPKRKVTKVLEGWVNIYPEELDYITPKFHKTLADAEFGAIEDARIACVHVTGEYTVEE